MSAGGLPLRPGGTGVLWAVERSFSMAFSCAESSETGIEGGERAQQGAVNRRVHLCDLRANLGMRCAHGEGQCPAAPHKGVCNWRMACAKMSALGQLELLPCWPYSSRVITPALVRCQQRVARDGNVACRRLQQAELAVSGPQQHHLAIACHAAAVKTALYNASAQFAKFNHVRLLFFGTVWLGGPVLWLALFHFQITRVVVASPCRAAALSAASRLDTNDLEME